MIDKICIKSKDLFQALKKFLRLFIEKEEEFPMEDRIQIKEEKPQLINKKRKYCHRKPMSKRRVVGKKNINKEK